MAGIRVALAGVGNCASSLVQGVHHYGAVCAGDRVPGLLHAQIGDWLPRDICFSAAFDVSAHKVGLDLADAIHAAPNNTLRFAPVPPLGVRVARGPVLDGLGQYLQELVPLAPGAAEDVAAILRATGTEVLVCYLPVGAERAAAWYAEQALAAGCAFINCIPVFLASRGPWAARFAQARLPLIGDDIKSQVGATIVHRVLTELFGARGVRLDRTYQLNVGGNADFLNMLERQRLASKKVSKTQAVTSQLAQPLPAGAVHVGPSDHVPWLDDRKVCHIRMEGTGFGDAPLVLDLRLEVWDSPNSAGVVIDAIRCAKLALQRGTGGVLAAPSSWCMKSPPVQVSDACARDQLQAFIAGSAEDAHAG